MEEMKHRVVTSNYYLQTQRNKAFKHGLEETLKGTKRCSAYESRVCIILLEALTSAEIDLSKKCCQPFHAQSTTLSKVL